MVFWFAGWAFVLVWAIFRDTAIDYRLVVAGALAPDVIDLAFGGAGPLHSLSFSVVLLFGVMVATRGRRQTRRRLLALPIGTFVHLLLDGMWRRTVVFWWPFFGASFDSTRLPTMERPLVMLALMEVTGIAALVWAYRRFRLDEAERRHKFMHTGRLGRDLLNLPDGLDGDAAASC